jgi:hypothetical protein
LGAGARLFFLAIVYSGESFKRFHLTLREIYFTGVMSLLIIIVSAFFVGMVLALQGYNTLQKYGSSEAIGVLVALALVRELGPVVTALLFAGRAGTAITAEIGLMKTTEQPNCTCGGAAFLGRSDFHAHTRVYFFHGRHIGRLLGSRAIDRGGRRGILVANAGQRGF